MTKLVALDSNVVIYGILNKRSGGENDTLIDRTIRLIENLSKEKEIRVCLSAVSVAEILCKLPPLERENVFEGIKKRFVVLPFDVGGALNYSQIYYDKKIGSNASNEFDGSRACVKADFMIIASLISHGVVWVYSHDGDDFRKICEGIIPVQDIPASSQQLNLGI